MSRQSARRDGAVVPYVAPATRETLEREFASASARSSWRHRRLLMSSILIAGVSAPSAVAVPTSPPVQTQGDATYVPVPVPAGDATTPAAPAPPPADSAVAPAPAAPAAPAPGAPAAPAAPAAPVVPATPFALRVGMRGPLVRDLQRELRRRGAPRLKVDGSFGRSTAAAVRRMQARWRMPVTGVADAALMGRLGLQTLSVAGAAAPVAAASPVLPSSVRMDMWPTTGQFSSPFGMRWGRMHEGIDIADRSGPPVVVPLAGTVSFAGVQSGYGNLVTIDHGNGVETRYGHLAQIMVTEGQPVTTGTQLGVMGTTGRSTGVHLHFEVRLNGTAYNPLTALPPRPSTIT